VVVVKPWWETHPRRYWQPEDWAAARKAGVVPPAKPELELPDLTGERLLNEVASGGPKLSWGSLPDPADKRRREANRLLEKFGLRPRRW
jgi:hypothetical protein